MRIGKILALLSSFWILTNCVHSEGQDTTIKLAEKTFYEGLFQSLPSPYKLQENAEQLVIYKFYSPWCQSCMEELINLQFFVKQNDKDCKVYLFTIEESDTAKARQGFKVHYIDGLFERTKEQQVPLTFVFKNKSFARKYSGPVDYSAL